MFWNLLWPNVGVGDKVLFLFYVNFSLAAKYEKGFMIFFYGYLPNKNGEDKEEVVLSGEIRNKD